MEGCGAGVEKGCGEGVWELLACVVSRTSAPLCSSSRVNAGLQLLDAECRGVTPVYACAHVNANVSARVSAHVSACGNAGANANANMKADVNVDVNANANLRNK